MHGKQGPAEDSGRRVWKTHAPAGAVPWRGGPAAPAEAGAKVVVVSRNPKDAAVSMLHHTRNIPGFCFAGGWEQFAPLFLAGRVESGSIWEWHRGWWEAAAAHPESVLVVHFEDLKADLPGEVASSPLPLHRRSAVAPLHPPPTQYRRRCAASPRTSASRAATTSSTRWRRAVPSPQ